MNLEPSHKAARAHAGGKWLTPQITVPLLVLFVLVAMHLSRYVLAHAEQPGNLFLSIAIIHLLVLVLPSMLYYLLKRRKLSSPMFLAPMAPRHILLLVSAAAVLVLGTLLIKFGYQVIASVSVRSDGFFDHLTQQEVDPSLTGMVLSLVILPAVCEELFFRGVVLAEYRPLGEVNAVVASALCFALLHVSVANFPIYFFAGLLLGTVTIVSRSVIPSMLLHLLSNLLSLFASDRFLWIILQKNGAFFVGFLLVVLFGLALFLLLYSMEHLYLKYAAHPSEEALPARSRDSVQKLFLSPTFLALLIVFAVVTVWS